MIKISNLNKYYNKGRENELHVINDMSFELPEKGMVALFGKGGCGKTTLLNVLGGLDKYSSGSVEIDGNDIKSDTDDIRNRYTGFIFQNYNLSKQETCLENVADALRLCGMTDEDEITRRSIAALSCVGLEMYKSRTPDTLSGGQQQRIAIARAIVKNPRIILADEPTGNLDEENTVMIMDLLRKIAEDHLVVLVTHEANLVDYYCDTVVTLADGKIESIRSNRETGGYISKNKNDIWLGELERTELGSDGIEIEYYGEAPEKPVKLRIVNNGGSLYLKIESEKLHVLDETSEVRLREGVFAAEKKEKTSASIDMSALPPVECGKTGRLFDLKSSIKSGFDANFKGVKAGKKALLTVMAAFSLVMVILVATFGTAIKGLTDIDGSYNHNVIYLNIPDAATFEKLTALKADPSACIDSIGIRYGAANGNQTLEFSPGSFESFSGGYGVSTIDASGVFLPISLTSGMKTVAGRTTGLGEKDIVITTAVASAMIKKSVYSFISEPSDLIGLVSGSRSYYYYDDNSSDKYSIAGIVESNETAFYMSESALAVKTLDGYYGGPCVGKASDYGETGLKDDEAIALSYYYAYEDPNVENDVSVGEKVKLSGKDMTIIEKTSPEKLAEKNNIPDGTLPNPKAEIVLLVSDSEYIRIAGSAAETDKRFSQILEYRPDDGVLVLYRYAVIHSTDVNKTVSALSSVKSTDVPADYSLITPSDIRQSNMSSGISGILTKLITLVVFTAVMCLCMYFIMRSAMMTRVKEIGIYRAIGVSKKNILFRFTIESLVLSALTVFAAFLVTSIVIFYLCSLSHSMDSIMYYPPYVAAILCVFQIVVCVLCGIAPVAMLLGKTPSEILAKYDI